MRLILAALGAAAVSALIMCALPGAAQARTHRFVATNDIMVTFTLSRREAAGTLVRFPRNRLTLTLTRGRARGLTLRSGKGRSRTLRVPALRRVSVRLTLAARRGKAKLTVGRKSTAIAGVFVAESAVIVRVPRAVVRRGGRRTSAPTPAGPTAGSSAPAATAPAAAARLFAPTSVWNAPLPDAAPLDASSAAMSQKLRDTVAQNIAARSGPWISTSGTSPLYVVPADQPTVRVQLDPGSWKASLQQAFAAVPLPASAEPAAGADAHLTVWQPSTNRLWELYRARKLADGWHANYGGAMADVASSSGIYGYDSWAGLSQPGWGATATSLPVIAGTMLIDELRAGVIPHALAMNVPFARPKVYSWPAQRTDGTSTDPNAIPEGARFRLDPRLDIDRLNLPPMTRMMAKAAQRYGIIVRDQTGHAVSFFAENPAQYGTSPYTGSTGFYRGMYPNPVTEAFPWEHLQLLKMELRSL